MQDNKLKYVDGLRGMGAAIVYICHFVLAFYFAAYSLDPSQSHIAGAFEVALGKTPVNLLFNGNFAVRLFYLISGYVLCLSYFKTYDRNKLYEGQKKRYFRLVIPILFTNFVVFLMMRLGFYHNAQASQITKSIPWLRDFNGMQPDFISMLKESLFGAFFFGSNQYNGVLWTIPVLFLGALLVYAVAALFGRWKYRYVVYAVLCIALLFGNRNITMDYIAILSGYFLCDFMQTQKKWVTLIQKIKWILPLLFVAGLYLASYPVQPGDGSILKNTVYSVLRIPMVVPYHLAGALCIVFAVLNSEQLQRFFGNALFTYLGKISFSLYLIHFPIIATFSCWFFLHFYQKVGYGLTVLLDFVLTSIFVLCASEWMNRYVEGFGKKVEDFFMRHIFAREKKHVK